jgi:hypothetical protein
MQLIKTASSLLQTTIPSYPTPLFIFNTPKNFNEKAIKPLSKNSRKVKNLPSTLDSKLITLQELQLFHTI